MAWADLSKEIIICDTVRAHQSKEIFFCDAARTDLSKDGDFCDMAWTDLSKEIFATQWELIKQKKFMQTDQLNEVPAAGQTALTPEKELQRWGLLDQIDSCDRARTDQPRETLGGHSLNLAVKICSYDTARNDRFKTLGRHSLGQ